jgi:cell fate regulator YaaT (PSP1 superfamily)
MFCSIRFIYWDQLYFYKVPVELEKTLQTNDWVVVQVGDGQDLGRIEEFMETLLPEANPTEASIIVKQAEKADFLNLEEANKKNNEYLIFCRKLIKKYQLEMKLVDVRVSLNAKKVTFAFIADGRVDFRELVKELIKKYNKAIRMQQLGVRDEVKYFGDIGPCGRNLCCQKHLKELGNVTTDFAKNQQVAHRGAERLSGICSRLKCCLGYEEKIYEELNKKFPPLGSSFRTKEGTGIVVGYHSLRGTIDVDLGKEDKREIIEVKI